VRPGQGRGGASLGLPGGAPARVARQIIRRFAGRDKVWPRPQRSSGVTEALFDGACARNCIFEAPRELWAARM
jgi:hypothetical protein